MAGLSEAERAILDELRRGDRTQGALIEATGYSRTHIRSKLDVLEARGYVEIVHEPTSLWAITDEAPAVDD